MTVRNLDYIFKPRRIALIGASDIPGKVGFTVLKNLITAGFEGIVYPVNNRREAVQGIACYASVANLPHVPDLAIVCTPAATVPDVVRQCGRAGIMGLVILSAGFREAGAAGQILERSVADAAAETPGMRILGPNCLGFIIPGASLNASFASSLPKPGRVAFLSQSGALCTAVLDWALEQGVGFSCLVSAGNMLDVSMSDLIDYFGEDEHTDSMILYIESLREARRFMSSARAFARRKPIVVYKAGRFAASAQAAASHTGAMAGVDAVYEAAFERAGVIRVFQIDDVFDCAQMLARSRLPRGPRLAIVSNAGGPGVMATDGLLARHGTLANLSSDTLLQLNGVLPSSWSHGNPVDVLGDADPQRFSTALQIVLSDPAVDAALAIVTPQAMTDPTGTAAAVAEMAKEANKPVLAAWMGGASVRDGANRLNEAGIPTFATPDHAVGAFLNLVSYAKNLELLYETPCEVPLAMDLERHALSDILAQAQRHGRPMLSELDSKAVLESYGIPTVKTRVAHTADEAVEQAEAFGYPVVLKVLSPAISHKTDVGGVKLNLTDRAAVRNAFQEILESARRARPEATIEGVSVEPMITLVGAMELIIGAKRDPVFGPVVLVGNGGVTAELFQDRALGLPPLNDTLARRMLRSLRSWPLLEGYRGRPSMNVDRLVEVMLRFSQLIADRPEIIEVDINPVLLSHDRLMALDARVLLDLESIGKPQRPFAHLAIRPYPQEFIRSVRLADGTPLVLRPIKPEDEPSWQEFHRHCSEESVHHRFNGALKASHESACRFCFPDYDREMPIIAEVEHGGRKSMIGLAQLVADADHNRAEFAVLVSDSWQGRGLGSLMTEACLDIARDWGVRQVVAETAVTNTRMAKILDHLGFAVERDAATLRASKQIGS
jgi:acetyltransferase